MSCSAEGEPPDPGRAAVPAGLSRGELFAALCVLGFANGIVARLHDAVAHDGAAALANSFGISAAVWIAFVACPALLLCAPKQPLARADPAVAACALAAFMLPIDPLSWVALTGLALYLLRFSFTLRKHPPCAAQRGAWVLLATTGAMFWGHLLMRCLSGPILGADARLVGWFAGTEAVGNTVRFADGGGYLWINPACSSLANVSLAILCWVLFAQSRGRLWCLADACWCLLACLAVVAINVTRIGLMVLHREQFDLIHGPAGAAIANWLSVAAVLGVCVVGTRRGRLIHA